MRFALRWLPRRTAPPPAPSPIVELSCEPAEHPAALALDVALRHQAQLAVTAQAIASGNLSRDVQVASPNDTLGIAFRDMLAGLRRLVGNAKDAAVDVDAGAHEAGAAIISADASVVDLRLAIEEIARGAAQQMAHVHAATEAIADVSGAVDHVAVTAQGLGQASESARLAAERGAAAVRSTVEGIRHVADSTVQAAGRVGDLDALSQRIGAVVATIDTIAGQTNLLALNAAIEAARAGSHGLGFAVVAGEIRKLAERSKRETRQIAELVRTIQAETRTTAQLMLADAAAAQVERERADQAGEALAEIMTAVVAAARQVDAIAVSAQSATEGTHALGELMQPVRQVAEANAEATSQMGGQIESAAQAMANARQGTEALSGTAERLQLLISHFRLTEARREAVNIAVGVRCSEWTGSRMARIVDLSATGARIEGIQASTSSELQVSFASPDRSRVRRRARVMRCESTDAGPWVGIAFFEARSQTTHAA